jgi:NAD(P)H-dependent FMN reductase
MPEPVSILAFAGSARKDSFNKKLAKLALQGAANAGATVTYLDFRDLPLPLFDEDLEAESGIPKNVISLKNLLKEHQGFLIACPEYNSSITPLLKNAIDWASRPMPQEAPLACFRNKTAALLATSPGKLGGLRGLTHVRAILGNIGVYVLPEQRAIPSAQEAFGADGTLKDAQENQAILHIGAKLVDFTQKLQGDLDH